MRDDDRETSARAPIRPASVFVWTGLCRPQGSPGLFQAAGMKEAKDAFSASMAIVSGVASGELTPSEASGLAKVVKSYARTLQAVAFEECFAKLEEKTGLQRTITS
jgi:hypothetical protein